QKSTIFDTQPLSAIKLQSLLPQFLSLSPLDDNSSSPTLSLKWNHWLQRWRFFFKPIGSNPKISSFFSYLPKSKPISSSSIFSPLTSPQTKTLILKHPQTSPL
ncbi:hypothetical protein GIB67_013770, partial [Kingdonia uniflora]